MNLSKSLYYIFLFILSYTFAKEKRLKGQSFSSEFSDTMQMDIWQMEHNVFHCTTQCVVMNEDNLRLVSVDHPSDPIGDAKLIYLEIWMKNDCITSKGKNYCCRGAGRGTCADWISGQISSRKKYGYGSFIFMMRSAVETPLTKHTIWSCAALQRLEDDGLYINFRISLCFPNPYTIVMNARSGDKHWKEAVHLSYDASKEITIYRIDWTPVAIEWYIKTELIGRLSHKEFPIPNRAMSIKLMLLPGVPLEVEKPPRNWKAIMNVFKITYFEFARDKDGKVKFQTELMHLGETEPGPFEFTSCILGSIIVLIFFIWVSIESYQRIKRRLIEVRAGYAMLHDGF